MKKVLGGLMVKGVIKMGCFASLIYIKGYENEMWWVLKRVGLGPKESKNENGGV